MGLAGGMGSYCLMGIGVSVWDDDKVLEMDYGEVIVAQQFKCT